MEFTINVNANIHHHGDVAEMKEVRCFLERIMSAIQDFADKMAVHNNEVDAAVAGLTDDVTALKQQITDLQNSQGQITPADQALLDGIETKAAAVATKLAALDALTPPVVPPTP